LPPSWTTLYELTKLDDATFDQKLRDGSINPDMQRKDVARENRILSRERGRRRVENLVPISGTARRGKQVAAISARSASDPRRPMGLRRSSQHRRWTREHGQCRLRSSARSLSGRSDATRSKMPSMRSSRVTHRRGV
jgi:hypothetical protein